MCKEFVWRSEFLLGSCLHLRYIFLCFFLRLFKGELGSRFFAVRGHPGISFDRCYSKVNFARFVQVIHLEKTNEDSRSVLGFEESTLATCCVRYGTCYIIRDKVLFFSAGVCNNSLPGQHLCDL